MIILDPVTLGDVSFSGGPGTYYDKNGTLQTSVAGVPRVTYDPSDLTKAPYVLVEAATKNLIPLSAHFASWGKNGLGVSEGDALAPDGTMTGSVVTVNAISGVGLSLNIGAATATVVTYSIHFKRGNADLPSTRAFGIYNLATNADLAYALVNYATGSASLVGPQGGSASVDVKSCGGGWYRLALTVRTGISVGDVLNVYGGATGGLGAIGETYCIWGAQLEAGDKATSYIPTAGAPVTRPADIIPPGAGLLYSNVPEPESLYSSSTTYAAGARVRDAFHAAYVSQAAGNLGNPLTDITKWVKDSATNRWAMLDTYNNTQTTNPEEIILVLSPQAISQGVYLGNLDASEVRVSMVDLYRGVVYQQTESLIVSTSKSSFFRWSFNRIKRKSYFLTLKMPVFANALVTIVIRKPGGIAKCGMCMIGPAVDVGLSLMGLSTELKDFSTTTFNIDGTSETVPRNYAKRMSVDISVDNDQIDGLQETLADYRQKVVVYVGAVMYDSAILVGKFTSLKNVIESFPRSKMSMQIEGVV
jgi:hypothetical protein